MQDRGPSYFINHGADVSAPESLETYVREFDITVCEQGFIEAFAGGQSARTARDCDIRLRPRSSRPHLQRKRAAASSLVRGRAMP